MPVRIIPEDQLPKYNGLVDCKAHPLPLAWHLMLQAGLRVGEIVRLAWCDLIWQAAPKDAIDIDAAIAKGGRARTVPVSKRLADTIQTIWKQQRDMYDWAPAHYALAKRPNGRAVTVRTIERSIQSIGNAAGGTKLTPHMLRHTFATRLLRVTNLRTVQLALGHARIGTTEIYTHPNQDDLRKAISQVP